jgi:hypothetical protein
VRATKPRSFALHVYREIIGHMLQLGEQAFIGRRGLQHGLIYRAEHPHRIVAAAFPQFVVPAKQRDGVVIPGPTQVVSKRAHARQCGRQHRRHIENANRFHWILRRK